ncbi:MNIO family bufferin maturase [Desertibaculum subflavum]|uniref:MNIO family bufferin maturase n=1 Tax=Desertibaculum subflavum TaxID=2268458 RepID=UPI000E668046
MDGSLSRAGIGLRQPHRAAVLAARPSVGFLEVHAENYLGGPAAVAELEILRRDFPISVHAVGLSLGSADGLDARHLDRVAGLVERIEPALVSEHLAWSLQDGRYLNDLLPLPYTEEALDLVAGNIAQLQDRLRRAVLIENPSTYLRFAHSTIDEAAFLAELARRTGCGLLVDVNNLHVNAANHSSDPHDIDPLAWLDRVPAAAVGEIHLAGHAINDLGNRRILIDDHGSAVPPPVWRLYEAALRRFPVAPALIEWDTQIPALEILVAEAHEADRRRAEATMAGRREPVAA